MVILVTSPRHEAGHDPLEVHQIAVTMSVLQCIFPLCSTHPHGH